MQIRHHRADDSDAIAEILALGWQQAYSGFLPAEIIAPRADVAARRAEMREFLETDFDAESEAMLVADSGDGLAGFAHMMLGDKGELGAVGQINLIYVRPEWQGRGIGRALLRDGAQWIAERASGPLAIAAFAENPFHAFYARLGGTIARRVPVEVGGFATESVIYLWPDVAGVAALSSA